MPLGEYIQRIDLDGKYRHKVPPTTIALVDTSKAPPLHQTLANSLQIAFEERGDTVVLATDNPADRLPDEALAAIQFFDLRTPDETKPRDFFGRFKKPKGEGKKRTDKKAVVAGSADRIPVEGDLTGFARTFMGRRGGHFSFVAEGSEELLELDNEADVLVASMEGNTAVLHYDISDSMRVFLNAAARLSFLAQAEMVNTKEGLRNQAINFTDWINSPQVRGMQTASHILAKAKPRPLIWDLDLGQLGISRKQQRNIMRTLKTAGLGEGMQLAVVEDFGEPLLAVTETGVTKTDTDPNKGSVVALSGVTEFGSQYQILYGVPSGHIINLFKSPTKRQLQDTFREILNSVLRGNFRAIWKDMARGKPIWIDHPGSIESHESALIVIVSALLEAGVVRNFKEAMEYLENGLQESKVLPIIPKGLKPGIRSGIHTHNYAQAEQDNLNVRVIEADMEGFGYPHSPPCGSREAALLLISALCDSYEEYGLLKDDEVRIINLPGHGSFTFSKKDIDKMAKDMATIVKWLRTVTRY